MEEIVLELSVLEKQDDLEEARWANEVSFEAIVR